MLNLRRSSTVFQLARFDWALLSQLKTPHSTNDGQLRPTTLVPASVPVQCYMQRRNASTAVATATATATAAAGEVTQSTSALVSFWQSVAHSKPVAYMQDLLIDAHDASGLPWWGSIIVTTLVLRTVITLPLTIYQQKIMARIERLSLEMPAIVTELKKETALAMRKFDWTEQHARIVYNRSLKQQWNKLVVRDNCHPAKTLIVLWGQIPLWISQSVAIRNLVYMQPDPLSIQAQLIFAQLTLGGVAWIPNLTEVDSSYILPVALGIVNLAVIEMQAVLRPRAKSRLQRYATNGFRALSVILVPIACTVPAALCVYWVTSSAHGFAQNLVLASPAVRRALGIPITPTEVTNPYERLWQRLRGQPLEDIVPRIDARAVAEVANKKAALSPPPPPTIVKRLKDLKPKDAAVK